MAKKTRRRAPGEGAMFQDRRGRWNVWVTSERKRYYKYATSREQAALKLLNLQEKKRQGLLGDEANGPSATVEQLIRQYVRAGVDAGKIRGSTEHRYEGIVHSLRTAFGSLPARDLTQAHIEEFYAREYRTKSAATVLKTHNLLHAAFSRAVEHKILKTNECVRSLRPKIRRPEVRPFTLEEVNRVIAQARIKNHRDSRLIILARWTGLRSGELLGLQWSDVDFQNRVLHVQHSLNNFGVASQRKLGAPKSGKSRIVPLSSEAMAALKEQREYLMCKGHPRPWVFPNTQGGPQDRNHLRQRLTVLYEKAEVPVLDVHALRHTFATLALKAGMDYKTLQKILGHHSVALTIDTYAHLSDDDLRRGIEKMEAAGA